MRQPQIHTLVFHFLLVLLQLSRNFGQNIPPIACPQIFQYLAHEQQYIGHIALPLNPELSDNKLEVKFSQRVPPIGGDYGSLTIMDNDNTIRTSLKNGRPLNYRIDFPNPGILPKLTEIAINDNVLCQAPIYPPDSWTLELKHELHSESTPLQRGRQPARQPPRQPVSQPDFQPELQTEPQFAPPPARRPLAPRPAVEVPTFREARPLPQPTSNAGFNPAIFGSSTDLNSICGREGPAISPLIAFGRDLNDRQMPWMVALYQRESNDVAFLCGGTLISANTVVSAGHCFSFGNNVVAASQVAVSLGRKTLDLLAPGQRRRVTSILIHDHYSSDTWTDADIALLKLHMPVSFTDTIKPICLWNDNYQLDLPSGHTSYVAGWGADEKRNVNTKIAKIARVNILTNEQCINGLRLPDSKGRVTANTICASNNKGAGPCKGDSGGGLMLEENNVWVLRGIVSAGQVTGTICDLTQPVIYTDLARHITWLRSNMWI
ncbi:serine protease 33 [Drosophila tropicalis]|uniref:serine protease 33 n=1 Tax=Drosophila tropicalis TaxID=46794 RepID=UPI0035AB9174